ncbi:hypothetical protein NTGHW29_510024 [Candidatus Nitrotoga sp. HW29]|nr:hypothetical protein NTGHW29_510024 [Candidatus Nitrotoga sp. HW29]
MCLQVTGKIGASIVKGMVPVANQSILFEIIGTTMYMFLAIVHMEIIKAKKEEVMVGAVVVLAGGMTEIKLL